MDRVRRGEHDLRGLDPSLAPLIRACLAPDTHDRPTLPELRAALGAEAPLPRSQAGGPTQPISLLRRPDEQPTDRFVEPAPVDDGWFGGWDGPETPHPGAPPTMLAPWEAAYPAATPVRSAGLGERLRRASIQVAGLVASGALAMHWPLAAPLLLVILAWLLRSGSSAADAHGLRRNLRGRKWYDGLQLLMSSPWHLVSSIPGTIVLAFWAAGMTTAAVLVSYSLNWPGRAALGFAGAVFALCLQVGPGSDGVSRPEKLAVARAARYLGPWLVVLAVLLGLAAAAYLPHTTSWTPLTHAPWGYLGG